MDHVLTCTHCATQRAAQPHEQRPESPPGAQTQAFCKTCSRITAHWLGLPHRLPTALNLG